MNGFVATGGIPPATGATIPNSGFWPDISMDDARDVMRVSDTAPDARLKHALIEAMVSVNHDLRAYRNGREAVGVTTLAAVPAEQVDGESIQLYRYRRAVYCIAKANLVERFRDVDSTGAGNKRADQLDESVDDLRRDGRFAICDLLGRSRCAIELI
ncbi:Phage head completion protein (GPL) [Andreprevotia lacus DSM 23236]|jgi:hypothetical protein|uniref:Phage head completion protein (GPL) n=1 Tax=Andreprevotia lacus DSM 23236 TaxID=1121001 RepID=A0A1W1XJK3_9NEIS|nr:head completion/stabilization protein [Andreprevotia lacus]SMC24170.1 Phage head completion protein (GPL) [Andreprevotia lacus DSM 23236]